MRDWLTDRYRIEGTVGKGSAATVFRVWDKLDGRNVALKLLGNRDKAGYKRRVALFQQEYYTLVDLAHPFIIEVYDYGLVDGNPFYTMELLEGEELRLMAPMQWRKACGLLRDIASSLAIIHSRRLVHRDLSARNVRCNKSGRAKLIDFGAMVSMGAVKDVVGTAAFMAPEVVYAQPLEGRADLFSLGALAYWLLSGQYAFAARNIQQLKDAWRSIPRSLVQINHEIPESLETLVMSMLSLDKLARPINAAEVIERLTAIGQLEQSEPLGVSQAYVTTPSIVGRERELGIFRMKMLSALKSRGSTVVLKGVSGVGRSRLLSSFVLESKLTGATVLNADGGGAHGDDYGVIASLVERIFRVLPEVALDAARPEAEILGHLIPSLRANTREVQLVVERDPTRLRPRIQRALQQVFTRVLNQTALMIAVDDIHLCDEPSVAALATLARIAPSYPLVLAVSLNTEFKLRRSKALAALQSSGTSVELEPLRASDVAWLVQSMFGDVANINIVSDWIFKLSRGNVRTCMELAQHLVDSAIARYQAGNWSLPKDLREQKLPQSLKQALQVRIEKLSPAARSIAESLSLVTEYAPLKLEHYGMLSEAGDEKSTFSALDELAASHILLRSGDDYRFSQPGYIDVLQQNLDDKRRRRIHQRLAAAYYSGDYHQPLVVVHHLQLAGEREKALELLIPFLEKTEYPYDPYPLQVRCFETALTLIEGQNNRKREQFLLRKNLLVLSHRYDLSLIGFGDELEKRLREDSGLIFWDSMNNRLDPRQRIQQCINKAHAIWESTDERLRGLNPIEAVRELLVYAVTRTAYAVPSLDVNFILYLRSMIAPFRTLIANVEFYDALLDVAIATIAGRSTYQKALETEKKFDQPISEISEELRRESIDITVSYYLALLEASTGNPSALRRADLIEQDPRFTTHAWEVRLVSHLFAGRHQQAVSCLRQKELLAIQNPESDAQLLGGLLFEMWAYTRSGDLMGLKRALATTTEKAKHFRDWEPVMLAASGTYRFLRSEFKQARKDLEKMFELAPIGKSLVLIGGLPTLVETLIEMGEFEEAQNVAANSLRTAEADGFVSEGLRELNRVLAFAEAKRGDIKQALDRIEATIKEARDAKQDGILLACLYETAARIAICGKDVDRFVAYAKAVADIYGPGKNPALIAKYAQLMMDAERAELPGRWRVQTPLETDFLGAKTATGMLQLVHSSMSECTAVEDGYEKALDLLVQLTDATYGYIYAKSKDGLRLMAPMRIQPAPKELSSQLQNYLESWHASRTGQQAETETLASRTLMRTGIADRSTVVTRDDDELQPLVLWVENQEQTEVVCVAALSALELPLDDLLWPFTSVIARYLLELRLFT